MSSQQAGNETPEAIGRVDAIFAVAGLEHGRRASRSGSWSGGERVRQPKASAARPLRSKSKPGVERVPGWEQFPWLRAGFSTRVGGRTTAYADGKAGELNLGWTASDSAENVTANRAAFVAELVGKRAAMPMATLRQRHTPVLRRIVSAGDAAPAADGKTRLRGDALITDTPGVLLAVGAADCVPVLLADVRQRVVAAFHAGWRGTLARIVERGVGSMRLEYGSRPEDLVAAIGPSIGACCYSVGDEVRFEFESQFAYAPELFSEVYDSDPVREKYPLLFLTARAPGHSNIGPQTHLDLWEANRRQLLDAGFAAERITVLGECTGCARLANGQRKYFSHRGEHGFTGRGLAAIGIVT